MQQSETPVFGSSGGSGPAPEARDHEHLATPVPLEELAMTFTSTIAYYGGFLEALTCPEGIHTAFRQLQVVKAPRTRMEMDTTQGPNLTETGFARNDEDV